MSAKVVKKSVLRPLQFITKIFDSKEQEMEIGLPTDVKHLAHIGFHGAEANGPSWMDNYHSAPLDGPVSEHTDLSTNQWASQGEISFQCEIEDSPRDAESQSPRPMRPRHSRRHQSDGTVAVDKDSSGKKKGHRFRKKKEGSKEDAALAADVPVIPKTKKKKGKGSDGGSGSARPKRKEAVVGPEEGGIRDVEVAKPVVEEIGALS